MAKGGEWERNVCKYLSKWINGTENPYVFWRGAGSGACFTKNNLVGDRFAGDIYPVRDEGRFLTDRFVLECKSGYKTATLDNHLKYNKKDFIREFWEQVVNDSIKTEKFPMLIFKKKGFPTPWLFISYDVYNKIKNNINSIRCVHIIYEKELPDMYGFEYKEFFSIVTPDVIKEI